MAEEKQRTVVLSIHQPSHRILRYIPIFFILSLGLVVHNGSLESLEETITKLGFQIPLQLNALEFAMEIINTLDDGKSKMYTPALENNEPYSYAIPPPEEIVQTRQGIDSNYSGFCSFFNLSEIMFLCSRFWKVIYRTKQLFLARTMQVICGLAFVAWWLVLQCFSWVQSLLTLFQKIHSSAKFLDHSFCSLDSSFQKRTSPNILAVHVLCFPPQVSTGSTACKWAMESETRGFLLAGSGSLFLFVLPGNS